MKTLKITVTMYEGKTITLMDEVVNKMIAHNGTVEATIESLQKLNAELELTAGMLVDPIRYHWEVVNK